MKTPLIFLALLFTFISGHGAQDSPKIRLGLHGCVGGKKYLFELDGSVVPRLPVWHPEGDSPAPVSLKRACEIGRATLKARYSEVGEFEITNVDINEMVSSERLGSWFYFLSYVGKKDGKSVPSCGFYAVVLMDGSSIEPVVTLSQTSEAR